MALKEAKPHDIISFIASLSCETSRHDSFELNRTHPVVKSVQILWLPLRIKTSAFRWGATLSRHWTSRVPYSTMKVNTYWNCKEGYFPCTCWHSSRCPFILACPGLVSCLPWTTQWPHGFWRSQGGPGAGLKTDQSEKSCPTNRDKYTLPLFSFTLLFPTLLKPPCCSQASSEEMSDHIKNTAVALTGELAPAFWLERRTLACIGQLWLICASSESVASGREFK